MCYYMISKSKEEKMFSITKLNSISGKHDSAMNQACYRLGFLPTLWEKTRG
jgi:hypothetical protein